MVFNDDEINYIYKHLRSNKIIGILTMVISLIVAVTFLFVLGSNYYKISCIMSIIFSSIGFITYFVCFHLNLIYQKILYIFSSNKILITNNYIVKNIKPNKITIDGLKYYEYLLKSDSDEKIIYVLDKESYGFNKFIFDDNKSHKLLLFKNILVGVKDD
jgi:hypothetical protein